MLSGNGDPWLTFASMFVLSLVSLFAGAFFGTIFRAFGTVWTVVAAIVNKVLTIALVAVYGEWDAISDRLVGLGDWLSIIITLVLAILAAAGSMASTASPPSTPALRRRTSEVVERTL